MGRRRNDAAGSGKPEPRRSSSLRTRAEKIVAEKGFVGMRPADVERLIHELQVHQIELEMQNEELKGAQSEIAESREKYVDLYDFAPVAYFSFDQNGLITGMNLPAASLVGIERTRLIGSPFSLLVSPSYRDIFSAHRRKTQRAAQAETCELLMQRKDGSVVPVLMESVPVSDEKGHVTIRSAVTDIAERKRAESRIGKEMEYKSFLLRLHEKAPHLGDKELCDYVLEEIVRLTDSTIGFFHLVSRDQENIVLTTWNREAFSRCTAPHETHYPLRRAGNWVDCVHSKAPVVYNDFPHSPNQKGLPEGHVPVRRFMSVPVMEGDKVRAIFGVGNKDEAYEEFDVIQIRLVATTLHTIMKQRHTEKALRKVRDELEFRVMERTAELSNAVDALHGEIEERRKVEEDLARQAELLNLTHDAIVARDLNQKVFFWNRGAEERYGWSGDEVKGKVTDDLLHTMFPCPRQEIQQDLLIRGRWEGEIIHTTRDGRKITVASRRALRQDKDGKPIGFLEINSDITEQKRIEEYLRQAQKMEAIGTLAGGIAHDFNNILAAILGFSELAVDDIPVDSKAQGHLKGVLKAGLRGRELVKQILAFSRKGEGERKQIILTPLVHETHALLRASLPAAIQISLAITTTDDYVLADPTQIQQVLMNLATNAAHAMREGGGQLTVGVSSVTFSPESLLPDPEMELGTYVKIAVKDTGIGMTEEVRQRIFEPFFTTKEAGEGTGMGLAVVYGIAKSHGGTVTVQSEAGQGSIFEVLLPRAKKPEISKEEETTSALPTGTERILFVDDEELLGVIARHMLESLGYHVTVAKHPTDAWSLFLEDPSRFDLVITDQTMPDATGISLAREMLRVREEMPIILCTGYSQTVSADKAKEVGIREFVMKPMVKKEMAVTIRKVLDGRKE